MKPNFALNITDSAISLLHRTSRGWLEVGSANFDAPDLEEALGYLRSSALGLSPHGITTKLILPPGQVLYTEVEAPGPDKAAREAQIRAALENRTPYAVDDLVFDWWGTGPKVKVAVVARETLDEAEAFAETHRFNPVSFVTTPAEGQFAGEPWFGVTKLSASVLPEGEKVTRDQDPVKVITRETPKAETAPKQAPDAKAEDDSAKQDAEAAELAQAEKARAAEAERAAAIAAKQAAEQQAAADKAKADQDKAAAEKAAAEAQKQAEADAMAAADAEALRKTETAKAEFELRAQELAQAEAKRMVEEAEKAKAAQLDREKTKAALIEAERKRADVERVAAEAAAAKAASFEGVTNQSIADAKGSKAERPELEAEKAGGPPAFASRRVDSAAAAPALGPASSKPAVGGATPELKPEAAKSAPEGDKPKGPAAPMVTSIAARKSPAAPVSAGPTTNPIAKPLNGTAAFGTGAKAELAKPKADASSVTAAGLAAAKVTAARIPGAGTALARLKSKSQKKKAPAEGQSVGSKSSAKQAAPSNTMGAFGSKIAPQRGKPRFLGLILTLVLLAALAAIAAWSSLYLSRDTGAPETVMQADATSQTDPVTTAETQAEAEAELPPATEIAATGQPDNQPPTAEMIASAEPTETAPAVAGTDAQAQTEGPGLGPQDEIFLATTDQAQPSFDPLAAPRPVSRPDTAPTPATLPPPFGTQYEFEPDGTIKATAKGVVMPDGFWLIAAKPPTVPPARPAEISAPINAAPAPDTATAATPPPAPNPTGTAVDPASASTAGISRMEGTGPSSGFETDATVENRRPKNRSAVPALAARDAAVPEAATDATTEDGAALAQDTAAVQLTSLRPRERSKVALAAAEDARKGVEAASLAAKAAADEKAAQDAAQSGLLTVALSPRPAARPRDFSGAVEAAIASASRETTRQVAAPKSVPEPEEADEPEVKVAAAPRIPTRANVAQQATFKNAINLSKINLIGVYGTDSKRYALVRSASGRYSKVRVGDRLDGGTVAAITRTEVRYKKGSRMLALAMPNG